MTNEINNALLMQPTLEQGTAPIENKSNNEIFSFDYDTNAPLPLTNIPITDYAYTSTYINQLPISVSLDKNGVSHAEYYCDNHNMFTELNKLCHFIDIAMHKAMTKVSTKVKKSIKSLCDDFYISIDKLRKLSNLKICPFLCEKIGKSETFQDFYKFLWNKLSEENKKSAINLGRSLEFNNIHLELSPDNWNSHSFDYSLVSNYSSGAKATISKGLEKGTKYLFKHKLWERNKYISELPKDEATYIKFAYNATMKAKGLICISNEYQNITPENANKEHINGFEVFVQRSEKSNRIIISFKDTDDMKDVKSDIQMIGNNKPEQLDDAMNIYKTILKAYPDDEIIITGHSLGGALTELVCSSPEAKEHGKTRGFAFNSYGTKDILKNCGQGFEDQDNVTVAISDGDWFVANTSEHVGKKKYLVWHDAVNFDAHKLVSMETEMNKLHINDTLYCKIAGIPKKKSLPENNKKSVNS